MNNIYRSNVISRKPSWILSNEGNASFKTKQRISRKKDSELKCDRNKRLHSHESQEKDFNGFNNREVWSCTTDGQPDVHILAVALPIRVLVTRVPVSWEQWVVQWQTNWSQIITKAAISLLKKSLRKIIESTANYEQNLSSLTSEVKNLYPDVAAKAWCSKPLSD
jgi:hypothetical protein